MESSNSYHIGIILDGNGRWAKQKGMPRLVGHNAGFKNVRKIVEASQKSNVSILTMYAFAIANWNRDKEEVDGLWNIFRKFFSTEFDYMMELGCQCRVIGERSRIPKDVLEMIEEAEEKSKDNTNMIVQVALSYDGVDEVARAVKNIAQRVKNGELDTEEIDQAFIEKSLDTGDQQAPDIVIRTGLPQVDNESGMAIWRSSSFLQLQSAQAVCVSTPVLWPDFSKEDLQAAIQLAKPDDRLFGGQRQH